MERAWSVQGVQPPDNYECSIRIGTRPAILALGKHELAAIISQENGIYGLIYPAKSHYGSLCSCIGSEKCTTLPNRLHVSNQKNASLRVRLQAFVYAGMLHEERCCGCSATQKYSTSPTAIVRSRTKECLTEKNVAVVYPCTNADDSVRVEFTAFIRHFGW